MTRPGMTQPGIARPTSRSLMTALCAACLLFPSPAAATPVYRPDNGHYYEVVHGNGVDWSNAKAAAESLTYAGSTGHLVTITDQAENLWLTSTFGGGSLHFHWIGAYQPAGSSEPGGGWSWVTGESWGYTNWWPYGEPNNFGGNENAVVFDHGITAGGKSWNDLRHDAGVLGYVVEYSSPASPVPESTSFVLLGTGLIALMWRARSRRALERQSPARREPGKTN